MQISPAIRGRYFSLFLVVAGLFVFGLGYVPVSAAGSCANPASLSAVELLKCGVKGAAGQAKLPGPDKVDETTIGTIVGKILNPILVLLGTVFVVLVIYSGIQWMTAQGNEEKITAARGTIIHAAIGLAIVTGAYVILNFVVGILSKII